MAKQLLYSDAARAAILKGVNQLADAVKATLGPKGRNAILIWRHRARGGCSGHSAMKMCMSSKADFSLG